MCYHKNSIKFNILFFLEFNSLLSIYLQHRRVNESAQFCTEFRVNFHVHRAALLIFTLLRETFASKKPKKIVKNDSHRAKNKSICRKSNETRGKKAAKISFLRSRLRFSSDFCRFFHCITRR